VLYFYQVATQPHFVAVVSPPPPPLEIGGAGGAKKKRERRGGLLHEQRYLAEQEAAVPHAAAQSKRSHPSVEINHDHEDEEIILSYLAAFRVF
jgi:hypothetical protein